MEFTIILGLIGTFVVSVSITGVLALRPRRVALSRLKGNGGIDRAPNRTTADAAGQVKRRRAGRKRSQPLVIPVSMVDAGRTGRLLHQAGYRSARARHIYSMARAFVVIGVGGAFLAATQPLAMQPALRFFGFVLVLLLGYIAPRMALRWRIRKRQHRLRLSLPDALDLMVICVEAGMGLNQAIVKVSDELSKTHPEISEELKLVNLEIRSGRTRAMALKNLGERTGVDDIISFATMLIQTDKFGTSVARSLRTHSESLRTERRQRAEEAAAKTTIKLIFPLLLCIFPALLVVILGPAFLNLAQIFGKTFAGTH